MSGFQLYATVCIVAAVLVAAVHYVLVAQRRPRPARGMRTVRRYSLWERLVHLALLVSFLVLAATGFYASIGWGGPMSGYLLMVHTIFGAVFAVSVAAMLVTWAAGHAFAPPDGQWLRRGGCLSAARDLPAGRFDAGDKVYFWLAAAAGLTTLLSTLLSMTTLFGTAGQALLYDVHRWSSLVLVIATIWHAYMTTLAKPGALGALLSGRVSRAWAERYHPLWGRNPKTPKPSPLAGEGGEAG